MHVREAAAEVGKRLDVPAHWLNDAAEGFMSPQATTAHFSSSL
jgi:hypothetical protein